MTKLSPRSENTAQESVLAIISRVADMCAKAMPDAAVERVIRELDAIKSAVEDRWPLPPSVKEQIDLGPFAAKNISDWNPALADTLMRLYYALQQDGESLAEVIRKADTQTEEREEP